MESERLTLKRSKTNTFNIQTLNLIEETDMDCCGGMSGKPNSSWWPMVTSEPSPDLQS